MHYCCALYIATSSRRLAPNDAPASTLVNNHFVLCPAVLISSVYVCMYTVCTYVHVGNGKAATYSLNVFETSMKMLSTWLTKATLFQLKCVMTECIAMT